MKILKYFKFVYLAFAAFLLSETYRVWNQEGSTRFLYLGMALVAIFLFFFRMYWEKKLAKRNQK